MSSRPNIDSRWIELETDRVLDEIIADRTGDAVVLFKHSIRCGVSTTVKKQLENEWKYNDGEFKFYYLDLITHRSISDQIAERLQVVHESPQIIVVKNGEVLYHASHSNISINKIENVLTIE